MRYGSDFPTAKQVDILPPPLHRDELSGDRVEVVGLLGDLDTASGHPALERLAL